MPHGEGEQRKLHADRTLIFKCYIQLAEAEEHSSFTRFVLGFVPSECGPLENPGTNSFIHSFIDIFECLLLQACQEQHKVSVLWHLACEITNK